MRSIFCHVLIFCTMIHFWGNWVSSMRALCKIRVKMEWYEPKLIWQILLHTEISSFTKIRSVVVEIAYTSRHNSTLHFHLMYFVQTMNKSQGLWGQRKADKPWNFKYFVILAACMQSKGNEALLHHRSWPLSVIGMGTAKHVLFCIMSMAF
jgi:hypothetical protein